MNNDYICHHGVKGMHWGVRRYQNPDGTLTDAGKKHANKLEKKRYKREAKQAHKSAYLDSKRLSDSELRSRTNRINLERNYRNAVANEYNDVTWVGRKVATKHIKNLTGQSIQNLENQTINKGANAAGKALYKKGNTVYKAHKIAKAAAL